MASKEAFAVACIELFSRLWAELDSLAASEPIYQHSDDPASSPQAEMLRLELFVVLGACGSTRWRMLLNPLQRRFLQSLVGDVLDALNAWPEEGLRVSIERAQKRILDAFPQHCRVYPRPILDRCQYPLIVASRDF
jgi:hypothetical protein